LPDAWQYLNIEQLRKLMISISQYLKVKK